MVNFDLKYTVSKRVSGTPEMVESEFRRCSERGTLEMTSPFDPLT
jgi:hypothetical protein